MVEDSLHTSRWRCDWELLIFSESAGLTLCEAAWESSVAQRLTAFFILCILHHVQFSLRLLNFSFTISFFGSSSSFGEGPSGSGTFPVQQQSRWCQHLEQKSTSSPLLIFLLSQTQQIQSQNVSSCVYPMLREISRRKNTGLVRVLVSFCPKVVWRCFACLRSCFPFTF